MKNYSLHELREMATTPAQQIHLDLLISQSYADFVSVVDRAIDYASSELSKNPQLARGFSEDQISIQVVNQLKMMGFRAAHDLTVGGHCDIVIEFKDTGLWLGEAKKFGGDYTWLQSGFQQLDTRYSTGSSQQTAGGLIIYIFNSRALDVMENWRVRLSEVREGIEVASCTSDQLAFRSRHKHERSGLTFEVRHKPISFYFNPQDRRVKAPKSRKPGSG